MAKRNLVSRARRALKQTSRTKQRSILSLYRQVLGSMTKPIVILTILSVIVGLAESGVLVIVAQVAVGLSNRGSDATVSLGPMHLTISISVLLGVAGALAVVRFGAQSAASAFATGMTRDATTRLRMETMAGYLQARWALKSEERRGHVQEVMTSFIQNIMVSILAFTNLLTALFTFLMLVVAAFILDARVAGLIAVVISVLFALLRPLSRLARSYARRKADAGLAYAASVNEAAGATQDIQAFGVEDAVLHRVGKQVKAMERMQHHAKFLQQMVPAVYQFLAMGVVIGGLLAVSLIEGASIAALSAIVLLFVRATSYGQQTQTYLQNLNEMAPYIEILGEVKDRYAQAAQPREGAALGTIEHLDFDRVTFSYRDDRPALDDVSFAIRRGEFIGVVGPSGAGKTTLVQLLLRLRDPSSGAFVVNRQPASSWSYDDWVQRVTFVPQEPHLMAGSVAENISFFRPGIEPAAIEDAARRAHVHGDIVQMPDGYDTWVGDDGRNVSGGQRQRIAIARALAGDPEIIVLDEPTSALDMRSEQLMQQTFTELRGSVTLVIVAHRLSTLSHCDRIMVFGDGKLQAFDTAPGLMESNAFYRQAVELSQLPG